MTYKLVWRRKIARHDPPSGWGHRMIVAQSGFGKDTLGTRTIEHAYEAGKKVVTWDINRLENVYYNMPETRPDLTALIRNINGETPQGYPTQVICPVFAREGIQEYPINTPQDWQLTKLNWANVTKQALLALLGGSTEIAEQIIDSIDVHAYPTLDDFLKKINACAEGTDSVVTIDTETGEANKIGTQQTYRSLSRALTALNSKDIIRSQKDKGAFHLWNPKKIMHDKKTITSITGFYCHGIPNFMITFFEIMQTMLNERLQNPGKYPSMLVNIPEVSNYSGNLAQNPRVKTMLYRLLQESRDAGMEIQMNTQSPENIDGPIKTNVRTWYIGNLNQADTKHFNDNVFKIKGLTYHEEGNSKTRTLFQDIPRTERGYFHKLWKDEDDRLIWRKSLRFFLPLSHKKSAYENVFAYLKRHGHNFQTTTQRSTERLITQFASDPTHTPKTNTKNAKKALAPLPQTPQKNKTKTERWF